MIQRRRNFVQIISYIQFKLELDQDKIIKHNWKKNTKYYKWLLALSR